MFFLLFFVFSIVAQIPGSYKGTSFTEKMWLRVHFIGGALFEGVTKQDEE